MDGQLTFGELIPQSSFQDQVKHIFFDILSDFNCVHENCAFKLLKQGGISVLFFSDKSNVSFWVTPQKASIKFEIKGIYDYLVDSVEAHYNDQTKNKIGRYTEKFITLEDLYLRRQIIRDVYSYRELEAKGRLFDCCHRYIECSDAKDCTHPDKDFRMSCSYRRKLKRGTIFFGKNRNIE